MNDLEQKRQKVEKIAKVGLLGALGFLFAPFAYATITGLLSLIVVSVIGLAVVNIGVPWFAASLANWRLKALKAVAAANPIEQLENRYAKLKESLLKQRENIKQLIAIGAKIYDQIKNFESQFEKPSPRREQYEKLNKLVELSKNKYQNAQINLEKFKKVIEEKQADWAIVLSMNEANKLAKVGEDFTSKLMADTALNTVQQGLDMAFAELDAVVMDENIEKILTGQEVQVAHGLVSESKKLGKDLVAPSELDFDAEIPGANRQKIAVK